MKRMKWIKRRKTTVAMVVCLSLILLLPLNLMPIYAQKGPLSSTQKELLTQKELPVPRNETVVFETDVTPTVFDSANPFIPHGTQWGSGWHQIANEWDWYINYVTGEIIYWRITGWEYKDNYTKFILHIRPGVKWNDGVPYTAEDYIFSVELQKKIRPDGPIATKVKSVRAIDKYTVEFTLNAPDPRFHHYFRMWGPAGPWIVAKHVWEGKDPNKFKNWPPTETGPYKIWKVFPELKMFVWVRDEDYWAKDVLGKFPGPKYVIYRRAPPSDIDLADFVHGMVDGPIPFLFTWDMVKSAKALVPFVVEAPFDDPNPIYITVNTIKYPLSLPKVRWAISYLINREKLARIYPFSGNCLPCKYLHPQRWGVFKEYAYPDLYAKYKFEYNPEKAVEIFKSLGFKKGSDGIWVTPNGTRLSWTILAIPPPYPTTTVLEDLANEMKKIGIDAHVEYVSRAVIREKENRGEYDITEGPAIFDPAWIAGDLYFSLEFRHSRHLTPPGKEYPSYNPGRWSNPELDEIVDKAATMSPEDPRLKPLYKRAIEILLEELPYIPAVEKTFHQIYSSKYWTGWPSKDNMYTIPFLWWPTTIFILFNLKPVTAPVAPTVSYVGVWFMEDVPKFVGADGKTYGPFTKGSFGMIPKSDAERLVKEGKATYHKPVPPEISSIAEALTKMGSDITRIESDMKSLSGTIDTLSSKVATTSEKISTLAGQISILTTTVVVEAIAIVILAIAIALLMRRKRTA